MRARTRTSIGAILLTATSVALAGCGGGDEAGGEAGGEAASAGDVIEVMGTDALAFEPEELTATAGEITIELTSGEGVLHTFVIDEGDQLVVEAAAGATATGTIELEPGEYIFYCDVPGHRQAGMEGTLTVDG